MKRIDLTNLEFGFWRVLRRGSGRKLWVCQCRCGVEKEIDGSSLKQGDSNSCGCNRANLRTENIANTKIGKKFGRYQVLAFTRNQKSGVGNRKMWLCLCACGTIKELSSSALTRATSCGCINKERMAAQRGPAAHNWKGGIVYDDYGYRLIRIPEHHRAKSNGYVREHIVVMEAAIRRRLFSNETVHHVNGIKDDNRIENLELWSHSHPSGQRAIDLIAWAKELLKTYEIAAIAGSPK